MILLRSIILFQTSNGTIVGNRNLTALEEYQLNDLDMVVLASGDEGVVLQFIDQIVRTITFTKSNVSCFFINIIFERNKI